MGSLFERLLKKYVGTGDSVTRNTTRKIKAEGYGEDTCSPQAKQAFDELKKDPTNHGNR